MQRNGHQSWSWPLAASWGLGEQARSNNLALWQQEFQVASQRLGLQLTTLGSPLGQALVLASRRPAPRAAAPRRLVACGFHGEEPAGPWGLLRFLQRTDPLALDAVHLSLLPLVNRTGFLAGTRFNAEGDNPNRGFLGADAGPSAEGRVLLAHADTLREAGRDGVLSCHEDVLADKAYVYGLEHREAPGPFTQHLLQTNLRYFEQHADGKIDNCPVKDGVIFNQFDGSFEHWMFTLGVHAAACVETPALQPFEQRVAAQAEMIETFLLGRD